MKFEAVSTKEPSSWLWDFGDGTTSSEQNPTHSFTSAGFRKVSLVATTSSGSKQKTRTVTIMPAPATATFVFSPDSPVVGQTVMFADTSTGDPAAWSWDFGDGGTSTAKNPSHVYTREDQYSVTLISSNGSGSKRATQTISVASTSSLAASFTYSPASPTAGQLVQFTDTSTGSPSSWQWNFGDGGSSATRNPNHSFSQSGSYNVTLTVSTGGETRTASRTVVVSHSEALVASFVYSPTSPAIGQAVYFTDTSTGSPIAWHWSFGDGSTSTLRNPSHAYVTAGTYEVRLTVTNNTGSTTASRSIAVESTITASFTFFPISPVVGQTVQFTDTSTGAPSSWQWNFGDGGTSSLQNPSHTYTAAGVFPVTLTAGSTAGTNSNTRSVSVTSSSGLVPAERLYDWGAYCGVPGGIPHRTAIYRTLTPSHTLSEINSAIAACPNGQVVYLSAGTYNLGTGRITPKSGVTLRGAGPGRTIITKSGPNAIRLDCSPFTESAGIAVSSGYLKGSMSLILASPPSSGFVAGRLIAITEDSSRHKFDTNIGDYARDGLTTAAPSLSASRVFRFVSRITSVSGNTIRFATPIPFDFKASLNPKAYPQNGPYLLSQFGVENVTFYGCADAIVLYSSDRCWFKDLEFSNCPNSDAGHIQLYNSVQPEVRRCYIHDVVPYPETTEGMGIGVMYGTCNGLFIDNISNRTASQFVCNGGVANAFLYNYAMDCTRGTSPVVMPGLQYHGPQGLMNLMEGNIWPGICADGYHGSASHDTVLRNHLNGLHSFRSNRRLMVNLGRGTYYNNVIGNVIGDSSWTPTGYEPSGGFAHTESFIYVLGYPNSGNSSLTPATTWSTHPNVYPDPAVASTLLRHGNYDFYHRDVIWDNGISSRTIPDSFFYPLKPGFFGTHRWPAIGPDIAGLVNLIPAKARWEAYQVSGNIDDLFD